MSQHDTLTLREALRSIQYEATSLADAQVIALQALNATYPARAALSATQPAQAAQPSLDSVVTHWRARAAEHASSRDESYQEYAAGITDALNAVLSAQQPAQAAQGAGEVVAWALLLAGRPQTASLTKPDLSGYHNDWQVHPLTYADTQPAAGADVLKNAARYERLRDKQIQWVHKRAWISFEAQKEPGLSDIFETSEARNLIDAAIDAAIAASGRQE